MQVSIAAIHSEHGAVLQWTLEGLRAWESRRHKNSNEPEASTSSTASETSNGGELRKAATIPLPTAGTVASERSALHPVSCTVANPSEPATCTATEPDSSGMTSLTVPLNCTKAVSMLVETYVNRIVRDSDFQRLIHSIAWSGEDAVFLLTSILLGLDVACQLATDRKPFPDPVMERVRVVLLELSKYTKGAVEA